MKTTEDYLAHLKHVQQERDYYNSNITRTIESGRNNPDLNHYSKYLKGVLILHITGPRMCKFYTYHSK